jgi:tRNA (cytidine/uridine-2'-O-)-methyltransferase
MTPSLAPSSQPAQSIPDAPVLQLALWEPRIPPNTGNIARTCAATGTPLHVIGSIGFHLDDKHVRRAGLDYWPHVRLIRHQTFEEFEAFVGFERVICIEYPAERPYTQAPFLPGTCLLFGNEPEGLPRAILERFADRVFGIPMPTGNVRSLNLATAAGIVLYEGLRQRHGW